MEHFADLRHSLVYGFGGLFICFLVSLFFFEALSDIVIGPLLEALKRLGLEQSVKFRTIQGGFFFHIKIAMLSALVFGMPVLTYQVWRFIAPGLYREERRLAVMVVCGTTLFFAAGVTFGYYTLMPYSFDYLLGYSVQFKGGGEILPDITLEDYTGTFIKIIFATGITFETPIFIGFLSYIGLVTHRHLIAGWRWATVFSFVIAAILTPPDYVTQSLLALPLMFFYTISIAIAWHFTTQRERAERGALARVSAPPKEAEMTSVPSPLPSVELLPDHTVASSTAITAVDSSSAQDPSSSGELNESSSTLQIHPKDPPELSASETSINLNSASAIELQTLPRIGEKLSQRIISARLERPFSSLKDLELRVSGLSAKMIEQLRALITL